MWTDRQLDVLKEMHSSTDPVYSAEQVAEQVGKSITACRAKLRELGLARAPGRKRLLTDQQALDSYVRIKVNKRVGMSEAAALLGVSLKTLRKELADVRRRYNNNPQQIVADWLRENQDDHTPADGAISDSFD